MVTAMVGATGSVMAIVYGATMAASGGTPIIVGGSLCLANSVFNLLEIGKINVDIKNQINELKLNLTQFGRQNVELEKNVQGLTDLKEKFIRQTEELQSTLDSSADQLEHLEKIKEEYDEVNKKLMGQLEDGQEQLHKYDENNGLLADNVNKLLEFKTQFQQENAELRSLLNQAHFQVVQIENLKNNYANEIANLNQTNTTLGEQVNKQAKIIEESKNLIQSLAKFGDQYTQFSTTIDSDILRLDSTTSNLDHTADVLHNLVDRLKSQTFAKLDANQDGIVTEDEFSAGLLKL
jgi:DNA repair exonuclease SbcCD ATPase subunit